MTIHHKKQSGFTLVETMIYLALFSIIMTGAVVSIYQMIESTGRTQTQSLLEIEGDFLIGKIAWALSGIQTISTPPAPTGGASCTDSDTLAVSKWSASIGTVLLNLSGDALVLSRGGFTALPLNNTNTAVSGLVFTHCYTGGDDPESVSARFTLSARTPRGEVLSREFTTKVFVRK